MSKVCQICYAVHKFSNLLMFVFQGTVMVDPVVIHVTAQNYDWLPQIQAVIGGSSSHRILLVAQGEPLVGILGLANCLCKEPGGESIRSGYVALSAVSSCHVKQKSTVAYLC